jgi:pimeloyl-ACP methyl ester carboxylesterase
MSTVEPFRIDVPEEVLADLRERLRRTRWPEPATAGGHTQGVPVEYLRELCEYWAEGYDWRATEARLNAVPQFRTEIDGLGVHFLHVRSPHAGALPLVLTHGWPGSVVEFGKVIGPLVDPPAYGGAAEDAFHLVIPSLPGYGFSDKPAGPGWGIERIAGAWAELMARLGYDRYGAQGGDWGTGISTLLGRDDPAHVVGIHLNQPLAAPDPTDDLTDAERAALDDLAYAQRWEDGYTEIQSTKPQTIGYGLVDSPAALAAWIIEKFWSWTDWHAHLHEVLTPDELLDNLMLYWLPATGASAARLYWESIAEVRTWFTEPVTTTIDVPTGCSIFPKERLRPSRRWAARRYTDIRHWNELPAGGHFAAFEQPDLYTTELRHFFHHLR